MGRSHYPPSGVSADCVPFRCSVVPRSDDHDRERTASRAMTTETLCLILAFAIVALLGAPLFSIIGSVAVLSFAAAGIASSAVMVELYRIATNPTLVAIPLFTFAGY